MPVTKKKAKTSPKKVIEMSNVRRDNLVIRGFGTLFDYTVAIGVPVIGVLFVAWLIKILIKDLF
ncbi:MAG: hypothetical protein IIC67_06430 [Thaumarchaeota archaeon]|nr:hypothetical protein [Nitrososphaerota archaeon]